MTRVLRSSSIIWLPRWSNNRLPVPAVPEKDVAGAHRRAGAQVLPDDIGATADPDVLVPGRLGLHQGAVNSVGDEGKGESGLVHSCGTERVGGHAASRDSLELQLYVRVSALK